LLAGRVARPSSNLCFCSGLSYHPVLNKPSLRESAMRKLFGIAIVLITVALPAFAQYRQWQQWNLSSDDQRRFDSYFSRWQDSRQRNDHDEVVSMEKRMLDIYRHYNIPAETPFWRVSSNARSGQNPWRGKLSADDQGRFDSYFLRWQDYRQ